MSASRPVVNVYLKTDAKSTKVLVEHLAKHIDALNNLVLINFIYITDKNAAKIQQRGIRRTPTLIYGNRRFEGLDKIIQVLTPPKSGRENYGYGVTSPDEMLTKWQNDIIDSAQDEQEEEDDMSPDAREKQLRQKMAAMQKQRPQMHGVSSKNKIAGGRKLKATAAAKEYTNDDDFLKASRLRDTEQTPINPYTEDKDGELILEDYYLEEAIRDGKKVTKGKIHRGHSFQ